MNYQAEIKAINNGICNNNNINIYDARHYDYEILKNDFEDSCLHIAVVFKPLLFVFDFDNLALKYFK